MTGPGVWSGRFGCGLALLLAVVLALCGCQTAPSEGGKTGSGAVTGTDPSVSAGTMTLAYTATDSLNPFTAKTKTNQELTRLLYDGLIVLGADMVAHNSLAEEITVKGTVVTVKLKEARFTDGSRVTAKDVLSSMNKAAKASTLSYGKDFANVADKTVTQSGNLRITLKHEDAYFVNFLDFPVCKAGTDDRKNEDNKALPPVGSGRYEYHEAAGSYWLTANDDWYGGKVQTKRIDLLNMPDEDAIAHAVQVGMVDWYYSDLSDNTFPNMNGISKVVALPNLVYLGCNLNSGLMSNENIRRGVSAAIDRKNIVENAYFGVATAATGTLPDAVELATGFQTIAPTADDEEALHLFGAAGFVKNSDGELVNGRSRLKLKIIFNKENTARAALAGLVADRLRYLGCSVTVEGTAFGEYKAAVRAGRYDLYVGEMKLPDNLDLYPLLTAGGLLHPNVETPKVKAGKTEGEDADDVTLSAAEDTPTLTAAQAAYRYHTGKGSLTEVLSCVNQQFPVIPLCHRSGMLIYDRAVTGTPAPTMNDPFGGIEHCRMGS